MLKVRKNFLLCFLILYLKSVYCNEDPLNFSTKECRLTEPIYGHTFDFNSLHSELAHVVKNNKDDTFEFNLCGNLSRTCDGERNAAACLKRNGKEFILGRQHELHYKNGKMYFEFLNGSACPTGTGEFKLNIVVGCDYTIDKEQATVKGYDDKDCEFFITFETDLACLPEPEATRNSNCSIKDPKSNHIYDLLSLSDINYRVSDRNGSDFIINVCKPVLYSEDALCPAGSSICYKSSENKDIKKKFINYGTVSSQPVIENGQLMLKHSSSIKCTDTLNYTSVVIFYCDSTKNARPAFVGLQNCVYEFSFSTPLACNNVPDCAVATRNNEILDMSPLKSHRFSLSVGNKNYTFAICSAAGSPCMEKNGACVQENSQSTSLGEMNSNLRVNQSGSPYLLYENGAPCQPGDEAKSATSTNPSFWSTKIEFVCAPNATKTITNANSNGLGNGNKPLTAYGNEEVTISTVIEGPKIIENSNCQLLIQYQTRLACQEQISCKTKVYVEHAEDGPGLKIVDLTPLMNFKDNYVAKVDYSTESLRKLDRSKKFFLNVCRPLVSKYGLGCPGGSAACMAKEGSSTPKEEQSLGYPEAALVGVNQTHVQLGYFNGDICKEDRKTRMSTRIDFRCDMRSGRGTPILREITDCHYRFDWATNVICPAHMCAFDEEACAIQNMDINESYSLRNAPFTTRGIVKVRDGLNYYNLDLCDSHHKAETDYSQGLVNLFFSTSASCGELGKMNVQMRIMCSNETRTIPTFSKDCSIMLIQETPDICQFLGLQNPEAEDPEGEATESTPSEEQNNKHPAERTASIGAILVSILSLTFFMACVGFFAFSPERRESLKRLFGRNPLRVRYRRVIDVVLFYLILFLFDFNSFNETNRKNQKKYWFICLWFGCLVVVLLWWPLR